MDLFKKLERCINYCENQNILIDEESITKEDYEKMKKVIDILKKQVNSFKEIYSHNETQLPIEEKTSYAADLGGVCEKDIESLIGKTVYVTPTGGSYYEATLLGYGAYGNDKEYKTYCVLVKKEKYPFVDYFKNIYSKEEKNKLIVDRKEKNNKKNISNHASVYDIFWKNILNELGVFEINSMEQDILFQNKIYLLQQDLPLNFLFRYNIGGPYSKDLKEYIFSKKETFKDLKSFDINLNNKSTEKTNKVICIGKEVPKNLVELRWYQLLATVLFVYNENHIWNINKELSSIIKVVKSEQSRFQEEDIECAFKVLSKYGYFKL